MYSNMMPGTLAFNEWVVCHIRSTGACAGIETSHSGATSSPMISVQKCHKNHVSRDS